MNTARIIHFMLAFVVASLTQVARADFSLVPGDYYTSNYFSRVITQYDPNGNVVGSLTLPTTLADEVRGLAFGSDNLLYATVVRGSGFAVLALDGAGTVQQTYSGTVYFAGNLSFGKIALDQQYLYACGQNQLVRFQLGNPASGTFIYTNNQVYDVKPLPNGHLLVAWAYGIDEITTAGNIVRSIPLNGDGNSYTDIRGIEYVESTNTLFVTELGHTGFSFQIMKMDAATGTLQKSITFNYADDLFVDRSGNLLVGSRTQTPVFYSQDLNQVGTLADGQQMFVTQFVSGSVPPVQLQAVVSRKMHGRVGFFDVDLAISGGVSIECRSGGTNGNHTMIFAFADPLTNIGGASVSGGTGSVDTAYIDPNDAHHCIVNLTGVANAQVITVSLTNVADSAGDFSDEVSVSMGVLLADVNGDGFVLSGDYTTVRQKSGSPVDLNTFRCDINTDGSILSGDYTTARDRSGTHLP